MWGRFLLCAGVFAASSAASANEPVMLEPASPWHVDYAKEKCRLARTFGTEENRHVMFFEQGWPSEGFSFTVAGPGFERFRGSRDTLIQFGASKNPRETQPFIGDFGDIGTALIYSSIALGETEEDESNSGEEEVVTALPGPDLEAAGGVEFIRLSQGKRVVDFRTGNLNAPLAALATCSQDLIKYWGLDLDQHKTLTRMAYWTNRMPVVKRIVRDYPASALNRGEQGILRMRVMVEKDGSVSECELGNVTEVERLQSPACREMLKAEFEPALDAGGQPMRSYYTTQVVYKIGK